eukprot:TRINITY_DN4345_c1_g1_i4.p1 TRINITY_DN4345_c1_g1~~TRINITY_DN4345_c1_g1_i4.p1  ORF type:complete len:383 (-),score=44.21 TRINITY_DN4345_c1_g1_i4:152-1225(-)
MGTTQFKPMEAQLTLNMSTFNLAQVPRSRFPTQLNQKRISRKCIKDKVIREVQTESGYEYGFVPSSSSPKGVVHFVGGAFVGAAPKSTYSLMIDIIAQAGYSVITTPYALTFQHGECARKLRNDFLEAKYDIQRQGNYEYYVRDSLPVIGIGHSNGALMHLLMGSYFYQPTIGNVIISYNNKEVEGAIPVNLDGLGSAFGGGAIETDSDLLQGEAKGAVRQVGSIITEVTQGLRDFVPTPQQSRTIITERYNVPNTLLVKFSIDDLDESEEMYDLLNKTQYDNGSQIRRDIEVLRVPGTHATPCGPDFNWEVQREFNVQDALLMVTKAASQFPIRNMMRFVIQWMDQQTYSQNYISG